jgi:nitroreductase/FMN reductase [NAD(P)H]
MNLNEAIEKRFGLPSEIGKTVESNPTLDSILNRRSVREFSDTPIDGDLMKTLLAAAFSAPSKSDLQQARVVWIKELALKQAIADLSPHLQAYIARAPEFLVWCGDNTLSHRLAETHDHAYANNHLDQFMNPAVDAGIAMAVFMCAAESMGLACCPVSSIRDTPYELAKLLKLPQFVFPVAGLVLGYPPKNDESFHSMRLPLAVTVMENEYRQDADVILSQVEDYSRRREASRNTPDSAQREPGIFGIGEEYGWTEDKSRQYSLPARTDWGDFIKSQGFKLE